MAYIIQGFFVSVEEDNYEHGCLAEGGFHKSYDITLKADTKEELIKKIMAEFEIEREEIEFNACEEAGRVDIQRLENEEAYKASDTEIERFREGKQRLWLANYSGQLQEINSASW